MCQKSIIAPVLLLFCLGSLAQAQETGPVIADSTEHPLSKDSTGIDWVFSLEEAITKATETNRIVILKPVSYRSQKNKAHLSPSAETQRAISFVDSRVVDLLNQRFVPYYFDMDSAGDLYDATATQLAMELYPDLRYLSSMPTPPLLFMTPQKKFLGYASNFLSGQELLEKMIAILDENPIYGQLTAAERALEDPLQKARLLLELRQLDAAMETLEGQETSEAWFLRARIAREQGEWLSMKNSIKMITEKKYLQEIEVENILRYWAVQNLEAIKMKAVDIDNENPRFQEAMYYLGLALFHSNDVDQAIEVWQKAIQANPESAWANRLDLTQGLARLDPGTYLSSRDTIPSVLNRVYLCPNGNDDLNR